MQDDANRAAVDKMREAYDSGDAERIEQTFGELAADDIVNEYPQSGEVFRGRDIIGAMNQEYAGATVRQPTMKVTRTRASGDLAVVEGTIDYGDGNSVRWVSVAELDDGKVVSLTEYFASPFEAPEWRRKYRDLQ